MRLQSQILVLLLTAAPVGLHSHRAEAGIISFVGSVTGGEVTAWRSTATPKTLDIDGSNAYGSSLGALRFGGGVPGITSPGSSTFGWAFISSGTQYAVPGYVSIDNPLLPIGGTVANTDAAIAHGGFTFELTGVAADYLGKTVRVGVMADVLTSTEWSNDVFKGLGVQQTVGGSGDSGIVSLRGGAVGNGVPEMYFFDITNVTAGDRFAIGAYFDIGGQTPDDGVGGQGQEAYLGPVSWDIAPTAAAVPEPSSFVLAFFGMSMLIAKRRHRVATSRNG